VLGRWVPRLERFNLREVAGDRSAIEGARPGPCATFTIAGDLIPVCVMRIPVWQVAGLLRRGHQPCLGDAANWQDQGNRSAGGSMARSSWQLGFARLEETPDADDRGRSRSGWRRGVDS